MKMWNNLKKKAIEFFIDGNTGQEVSFAEFIGMNSDFDFSKKNFNDFIQSGYSRGTDVNPVVSKIAETSASIPWRVYERGRNGELNEVFNSGLNDLITNPNEEMSWRDFSEASYINLLTTGNAYQEGMLPEGYPDFYFTELNVLASQNMCPVVAQADYSLLGYEYNLFTTPRDFSKSEIIHTKYFNPTTKGYRTLVGLSPLEAALYAYTTSNNQWEAASNLLNNKGAIGFVSNDSVDILEGEEMDEAQAMFQSRVVGAKNFGKVIVTPSKMSYQQMGLSATDMKIVEMGVMSLRAICNIYHVNSSLFNDPANKKFNNVKEAKKELWTDANIPLLDKFKWQYNRTFVKAYSEREGRDLVLDYDVSGVEALHEDRDKQADRSTKLVDSGQITPNEGRRMNGMEPLAIPEMDQPKLQGAESNE